MGQAAGMDFNARLSAAFKAALPPPGGPKTLLLQYGKASAADFATALSRLPQGAFLLYLRPPCGAEERESLEKAAEGRGALVEELSPCGLLRERLFALMDLLKPGDVKLSVDASLAPGSEKLLEWLRMAMGDAFEKNNITLRTIQIRMRCALANLQRIAGEGRLSLPSIDPSTPVLICGAGPSISGQLDAIAKLQGRAVSICAGRSAKTLCDAGIKPDFVVDIEQVSHLYWPEDLRLECPLAAHEAVSPAAAKSFERFVWIDSGRSPVAKFLSECGVELPRVGAVGPVACIMIGFAVACGARRIGLCGFDLSISGSGKSYADGLGSLDLESPGSALEVPGVRGGTVRTLQQFEFMRRDVESAIDKLLSSTEGSLSVFNCCPSGAAIAGTQPLSLEEFASSFPPEKLVLNRPAPKAVRYRESLAAAGSGVDRCLSALDGVFKGVSRICAELEGARPGPAQLASLEKSLFAAFKEEQETRASGPWTEFSIAAFEQARLLMEQGPRPRACSQLDAKRLHFLRVRTQCLLHAELLQDLRSDLRELSRAQEEGREPAIDPLVHPGLRRHFLRRLAVLNPALAEALAKTPQEAAPEGFETMPKLLSPPIVLSMKLPDSSTLKLAAATDYAEETKASVSNFISQGGFDPGSCAVLFLGHVNWGVVSEMAFRHPSLQGAVVFPWLKLLSHMAGSCEFLGLIPEDAPLLCPVEGADWLAPLDRKMAEWKAQGRRLLLFGDARTAQLKEVSSAKEEIFKRFGG